MKLGSMALVGALGLGAYLLLAPKTTEATPIVSSGSGGLFMETSGVPEATTKKEAEVSTGSGYNISVDAPVINFPSLTSATADTKKSASASPTTSTVSGQQIIFRTASGQAIGIQDPSTQMSYMLSKKTTATDIAKTQFQTGLSYNPFTSSWF